MSDPDCDTCGKYCLECNCKENEYPILLYIKWITKEEAKEMLPIDLSEENEKNI